MTLVASQAVRIERHELADGLTALTFADADRADDASPPPLVFVLHGLGSRKERHLDLCLRLAAAGMLACAVDARHHGERWSPDGSAALHGGERNSLGFVAAFADAVQGTARDVCAIADHLGRERFGAVGHSMGGFTALHIALGDKRAAAVVNVAGSIDLRPPPGFAIPAEIIPLISAADPVARAAGLPPCALLLLHGADDETVPAAGARRLFDAAAPAYAALPDRLALEVTPGVGHEWTAAFAARSVEWLAAHLCEDAAR